MTTKAEWWRYLSEREKHETATSVAAGASAAPATSHAMRKAAFVREEVAPGARPSRMSTRKAANHQRNDGQSRAKRCLAETSPEVRASRWLS